MNFIISIFFAKIQVQDALGTKQKPYLNKQICNSQHIKNEQEVVGI